MLYSTSLVVHREIFLEIFDKIFCKIIPERFLVSRDLHATFHVILHNIFDVKNAIHHKIFVRYLQNPLTAMTSNYSY